MSATFVSAGTVVTANNASMTPGSPAGFQAGDILVACYVQAPGSTTPPDLSSFGFTKKSINTAVGPRAAAIYTKTAVGGDTMPSAQFGTGQQACVCVAYRGLTETLDQTSVERASTTQTSGLLVPSGSAPPSNNTVAIMLSLRTNGSATGVTVSNYGNFSQRLSNIPNSNGKPLFVLQDIIMTTPQSVASGVQTTSPADSAAQQWGTSLIWLQAAVTVVPTLGLLGVGV
jgi:hypothetical protein